MPEPEETPTPEDKGGEKTLTQAEVDRIVAERLERERKKYADYNDLKAKADKFDELEDANKSEVEKLQKQVADLTTERDTVVSQANRLEIAVTRAIGEDRAKRLTSAARRLTGSSREELEADADDPVFESAFQVLDETPPRPAPPGKPREDLKPGNNDPDAEPEETDVRKLGERMFQH